MLGEGAEGAEGAAEGDEAAEEEGEEEVNLHTAASDGNVEVLKQLLDSGAAVDEVDDEGRTALHFAGGCCCGIIMVKLRETIPQEAPESSPQEEAFGKKSQGHDEWSTRWCSSIVWCPIDACSFMCVASIGAVYAPSAEPICPTVPVLVCYVCCCSWLWGNRLCQALDRGRCQDGPARQQQEHSLALCSWLRAGRECQATGRQVG